MAEDFSSLDTNSNKNEFYMNKAINLAKRGKGFTSPNPLVGAVIVKEGKIVGEGYHPEYGDSHAEVYAIESAGQEAEDATMFVNLEPCNHQGKTPPCTEKIIEAGIKKVVIANIDPNPRVNTRGCEALRNHNVQVETGVLAEKGQKLNEAFFKYMKENKPFFVQKAAQTLDGFLATSQGDSRWITGEKSRAYGHKLRHELDAVLIGGNTLISDNPRLNVRDYKGEKSQPIRIILAGESEINPENKIFNSQGGKVLVFTEEKSSVNAREKLKNVDDSEVIVVDKTSKGVLNLSQIAEVLYDRNIMSVLIEGGGKINHSFLEAGLTDKFYFFLAPKLLGGNDGISAFSGRAVKKISETFSLNVEKVEQLQKDILITAYPDGQGI